MKPHHYLGIGLRVFAIILFVFALRQSSLIFSVLFTDNLGEIDVSISLLTATFVIPLITAIVCWFFPITIAKKIVRPDLDLEVEPVNYQTLLAVFILAIGLFLTFYVISDIVYWVTYSKFIPSGELDSDSKAAIATTAVETLVAFIFLCRARTIAYHLLRFTQ